jgi:hypothetical protein
MIRSYQKYKELILDFVVTIGVLGFCAIALSWTR